MVAGDAPSESSEPEPLAPLVARVVAMARKCPDQLHPIDRVDDIGQALGLFDRKLGFLGELRVNVLALNLAMDRYVEENPSHHHLPNR